MKAAEPTPPAPVPAGPAYGVLLVGATVLGLLASAQHFAVMQVGDVDPSWKTIRHALSKEVPWWYLWVPAAWLAIRAVQWVPFRRDRLLTAIPFHLVIALAMVLVHSAAVLALHRMLGFPTGSLPYWETYVSGAGFRIPTGLLGYATMFGAVLATDYYRRFRERELIAATLGAQLAEARLQALRMQLNPHFLFNAMNTIAMLVRRSENTQAVRMIAGLGSLLRSVLEEAPPQQVPLRKELAFATQYLELEGTRFPDRLRHEIRAGPELLDCLVPNLILQPLVENAIKHGVAARPEGGTIVIGAERKGDDLCLTVADDGAGVREVAPAGVTPATGIPLSRGRIGLANTRARLQHLYGTRARLDLENLPFGFVARITLPYLAAADVLPGAA